MSTQPATPLEFSWINTLWAMGGFIAGIAATVIAGYLTDWRKEWQSKRAELRLFDELNSAMPELFRAIAADLNATPLARFILVRSKRLTYVKGPNESSFFYCMEDHESLASKVKMLEAAGYVVADTSNGLTGFRLSESFVKLLRKHVTKTTIPSTAPREMPPAPSDLAGEPLPDKPVAPSTPGAGKSTSTTK